MSGSAGSPIWSRALAANHDLAASLLALYAQLKEVGDADIQARMLPGVVAALRALD